MQLCHMYIILQPNTKYCKKYTRNLTSTYIVVCNIIYGHLNLKVNSPNKTKMPKTFYLYLYVNCVSALYDCYKSLYTEIIKVCTLLCDLSQSSFPISMPFQLHVLCNLLPHLVILDLRLVSSLGFVMPD